MLPHLPLPALLLPAHPASHAVLPLTIRFNTNTDIDISGQCLQSDDALLRSIQMHEQIYLVLWILAWGPPLFAAQRWLCQTGPAPSTLVSVSPIADFLIE